MVGSVATPAPRVQEAPATLPPKRSAELRPEIQALRAVAVLLVVIYHFWISVLPGGFIGVDVFFAISGFLITSHLLREIDRTGLVSLPGFWARRARRILPAALLILLLTAIATIVFVPQTYWEQYFTEIRSSTAYIQNWHLAAAAVDYLAAANAASPVQHYWSLSAEEQFYIVWPVLILLAALVARLRPVRVGRRAIVIVLAAVTAASLAFSIHDTAVNPAAAYFVTPTRAWEFGAGGLLALLGRSDWLAVSLRTVLSWLGLAAIMVTAITYSNATPFPGYEALLPVLGALAVMWAGAPRQVWAPTWIMRLAPVQFLGDISYSVYLWHFPLLILAPFVLNHQVHMTTKIVIVIITILAAWITKILVEDPFRASRFLTTRKPRWTFGFVVLGTAVVFAVTASGQSYLNGQIRKEDRQARRILASHPRCFGAGARDPEHPCTNPKLKFTVVPPPIVAAKAGNAPCKKIAQEGLVSVCQFGVPQAKAKRTFALVGDSHAAMWRAGLSVVAKTEGWRGLTVARTSCPLSSATKDLVEPLRSQCIQWNQQVIPWFQRHPEVSIVFVAEHNGGSVVVAKGRSAFAAAVAGYQRAWAALPPTVKHIIVMRDTPRVRGNTGACVQLAIAKNERAGLHCAVPRSKALPPDPAAVAQARLRSPRVQLVNVTRFICDARLCYPVVGGALVFKDIHHLSRVYATSLGPYVVRRVNRLMRGWKPHR